MNNEKIIELREKIIRGLELAFDKLIQSKRKNDGELVFSQDNKIVKIKANELTK